MLISSLTHPAKELPTDMPRPIVKWAGGKSRLVHEIKSVFPSRFSRYIEPFAGGAAVFLAVDQSQRASLNDSNEELINLYKVVKSRAADLMIALDEMKKEYSEAFYYSLRKRLPSGEIDRAARFLFLNKTCFNGLYRENSKGEFNVPFGKRPNCPELYSPKNLQYFSMRLQNAELRCDDFSTIIAEAGAGDVVYCDPPYVPLSKTSSFVSYTKERFSPEDQERLVSAGAEAARRGATVVISNSSASISLYNGWAVKVVKSNRAINSVGTGRGAVDEIIAVLPSLVKTQTELPFPPAA